MSGGGVPSKELLVFKRLMFVASTGLVAGSLLAGCGVDDASDEDFVRSLCDATNELEAGIEAAIEDASTQTDAQKGIELLVPPLEEFVKAFEDADPPKDLQDWHKAASAELNARVDKFKDAKTLASLEGFSDSPVPDPPAAAKQRLRDVAEDIQECTGVAFLKPD